MKKHEIFLWALRLPVDFIIIFLSFFISRQIRLIDNFLLRPEKTITYEALFWFAIFWALLYIIIFSIHWIYSMKKVSTKFWNIAKIIIYSFYWFIFFSFLVYAWNWIVYKTEIPRLITWLTFLIWTMFVIFSRLILNNLEIFLTKKWLLEKTKIILINNKNDIEIKKILSIIKKSKTYEIIWFINSVNLNNIDNIKYIWWLQELRQLLENKKCDEILFIDSDFSKEELHNLWQLTRIYGINYKYVTNSFDVTKTNTTLSLIDELPVIEIKNTPLNSWSKIFKRIFDFLFWFLAIIILSPVFLIVSILIKIEDPKWPVIYKNKRIWQKWKFFNLYKFRYMKWEYCTKEAYWQKFKNDKALDFEKELIKNKSTRHWPLYKIKDDPRKTKIWTFIEKYSIDELPQFFNLVIWNMSLVWPRPHQPREVEKYSLEQKRLLTIKPWITWMAQVNWRENNDFEKEAELDIFYIENWSFLLDLKIILKTFSVVLLRAFRKK